MNDGMNDARTDAANDASSMSGGSPKGAPGRWPYLVALAAGIASASAIMLAWSRYARGETEQLGWILFCALPVLLGILAGTVRPERPARMGVVLGALSLAGAMPILHEGAICILMLTPIYLPSAALAAAITGAIVRARRRPPGLFTVLLLLIPGAAAWLEPRVARAPLPTMTIADSVDIDAPREDVWATMARLQIAFPDRPAGLLGQLLPRPRALEGDGVAPGAFRRVVFDNGALLATVTRSEAPRRFDVDLRVERAGREFFDHWAELVDASFTFDALPGGRTRMTHATRYRPRVTPRWYFAPIERFFAGKVQGYLLDEFVRQRFVGQPGDAPRVALANR
ncbi:MAG TPA: SRPBCC family protein [Polyangia bacterium]|nr:SRPBCC family protein [Polyangia bacterium]